MDEDLNSAEVEFTTQNQDSTIVDESNQYEASTETQGQEVDAQEKNWRELRRKAEQAEQQRQNLEEKLKMQEEFIKNLMQQSQPKQQPTRQEEPDEFEAISDEEYLPKGQSRKLFQKDARTIAREEYLALERERETLRFRERLKAKYSDFDDVVNPRTIEILEKKEPELANTIAELKDPYKIGLQTYNFIKSMGIVDASIQERHAKEVQSKLEKNEKSIPSPQVYNKRPMAKAFDMNNLSKDEKQRLYEEMTNYANMSPGY